MQNDIFNTSSTFSIKENRWTSFNQNFVDIYSCKKKVLSSTFFFQIGEEVI